MDEQRWAPSLAAQIGVLRLLVAAASLLCAMAAWASPEQATGWHFLAIYVAPSIALLIAWVLPWDILMAKLLLLGTDPPDHHRYRTIRALDLGLLALLLLSWGPFFIRLVRGTLR